MAVTFDKAGAENTDRALEIAFRAAAEVPVRHVVVASTYGDTARKALQLARKYAVQLVIVTHNTGFKQAGEQQFNPELREHLLSSGVPVVTASMPFRGLNRAIRDRFGYSDIDLVAAALRILGEGMKVCAEIACIACDAGVVPPEDIVCVAGTGRGADTVAIIAAQPSNRFFDLKIREILAKPRDF